MKHLQKPKTNGNAYQHYILTFELHNKLKTRQDAKKSKAVPDTRSYQSIANWQNGKLYVTFSSCCKGCLKGDEPGSNVVCPDEWKEYNFTTKNFGKQLENGG